MFTNLRELITQMPDEKACREYLIKERWNGVIICPYCGLNEGKVYVIEGGKRFKCGHKECYKKFSVTVGTIFEASNIPLKKWLMAIFVLTAHKKGISSYQLAKDIGCTQKTAWFMLHRIREMMRVKATQILEGMVEIDEPFVGGKIKNMTKKKRAQHAGMSRGIKGKATVFGMLQRGGKLVLKTLPVATKETVQPVIKEQLAPGSTMLTDGFGGYRFMDYTHEVVSHDKDECVRGNGHTNGIEGAFSLLKRGIIGIYHQVSPKHLSRYCDEFAFRYNSRDIKDYQRFVASIGNIQGRLTYKELIKKQRLN